MLKTLGLVGIRCIVSRVCTWTWTYLDTLLYKPLETAFSSFGVLGICARGPAGLVVPFGKNQVSLRVSLGIALTIAPNITRSVARQKLVHFGQLQLVRLGSTMPVAFLSAIRIEKKKGTVSLLRFPIALQGFGIS